MRHPFADMVSFLISGSILTILLKWTVLLLDAVRNNYSKRPPLSRFEMKAGEMKVRMENRQRKLLPWNSVENVLKIVPQPPIVYIEASRSFIQ